MHVWLLPWVSSSLKSTLGKKKFLTLGGKNILQNLHIKFMWELYFQQISFNKQLLKSLPKWVSFSRPAQDKIFIIMDL